MQYCSETQPLQSLAATLDLTPRVRFLGALYDEPALARFADAVDVVTYEFDEQRDRTWLAQNAETMRQDTDQLWLDRKDLPFTDEQFNHIKAQYQARQHGVKWENFERLWQGAPSQGGEKIRQQVGLDQRPVEVKLGQRFPSDID